MYCTYIKFKFQRRFSELINYGFIEGKICILKKSGSKMYLYESGGKDLAIICIKLNKY